MKEQVDSGIILRRVNYGESDRVVTLLTKTHGKIAVFAKGVRKPKSRLSGGIELLSVSELTFVQGKSELKTLTGARVVQHYDQITKNIHRTNAVFDALKQVDSLSDEGAGQEYFDVLEKYLERMADVEYDLLLVEAWFGLRLLHLSGVLGAVEVRERDIVNEDEQYRFNYQDQIFETDLRGEFSKNDIKLLRLLGSSRSPIRLKETLGSEARLANFTKTLFSMNLA